MIASQAAHTAIGSVGRNPPGKNPLPWNEMMLTLTGLLYLALPPGVIVGPNWLLLTIEAVFVVPVNDSVFACITCKSGRMKSKIMGAILLSLATFFSTLLGGLFGLRYRDHLNLILGFTAGVLVGLVSFDLLPEIFRLVYTLHLDSTGPMFALMSGFLLFHITEKSILIHFSHEEQYAVHQHPLVGILSAVALTGHSFLDGVGIGLGFQVSPAVGLVVAIAVISHDFSDGLNTVTLMLVNKNTSRRSFLLLLADAAAPVAGAISTLFFTMPTAWLPYYLGFFAGFLLYIGASDILPQAHSNKSTPLTIVLTVLGVLFAFIVTRFV